MVYEFDVSGNGKNNDCKSKIIESYTELTLP